jgi:hypothetical protein
MSRAQDLIFRKQVNLDFIQGLSDDKRVALLAALTHTALDDVLTFRHQIALALDHLSDYPEGLVSSRELAQVLSCHVGSVSFQINRLNGPIRQNDRPGLIPADGYAMIMKLVRESFEKKHPITIGELIDQIDYFFRAPMSPNPMSHILRGIPGVKTVDGVPMEANRALANPNQIDEYSARLECVIQGVARAFILNANETGFADFPDARIEKESGRLTIPWKPFRPLSTHGRNGQPGWPVLLQTELSSRPSLSSHTKRSNRSFVFSVTQPIQPSSIPRKTDSLPTPYSSSGLLNSSSHFWPNGAKKRATPVPPCFSWTVTQPTHPTN